MPICSDTSTLLKMYRPPNGGQRTAPNNANTRHVWSVGPSKGDERQDFADSQPTTSSMPPAVYNGCRLAHGAVLVGASGISLKLPRLLIVEVLGVSWTRLAPFSSWEARLRPFVSRSWQDRTFAGQAKGVALTPRELAVLRLLSLGHQLNDIAKLLELGKRRFAATSRRPKPNLVFERAPMRSLRPFGVI